MGLEEGIGGGGGGGGVYYCQIGIEWLVVLMGFVVSWKGFSWYLGWLGGDGGGWDVVDGQMGWDGVPCELDAQVRRHLVLIFYILYLHFLLRFCSS